MQIYIKLSIVPMLFIGIVVLLDDKFSYKFKISDLVLLLPIVLLVLAGDGRLTANFASNRTMNFNNKERTKTEKVKNEEKEEKREPEDVKETYDFSKPYFEIVDANYNELSNYITYAPKADKFEGKTIRVRGFSIKYASYLPDGYFALGKYSITCCAADAGFTGFIIKYDTNEIFSNKWYEIEGVLEKGTDADGYDIMYINAINVKVISSKEEEQYIYPCYSYGDGSCKEIEEYNLEY